MHKYQTLMFIFEFESNILYKFRELIQLGQIRVVYNIIRKPGRHVNFNLLKVKMCIYIRNYV